MKVLIIADAGRLRDGLQAMLTSYSSAVSISGVDDGPSAFETVQVHRPDLIILDYRHIGERSEDFVRDVKAEAQQVGCIVVVDRLAQMQLMLDAGADKVLLKGFTAAELYAAVEYISGERAQERPARGQTQR